MGLLPLCLLLPFPWGGGVVSMKGELVWTFFLERTTGKGEKVFKEKKKTFTWNRGLEGSARATFCRLFRSYFDIRDERSSMPFFERGFVIQIAQSLYLSTVCTL